MPSTSPADWFVTELDIAYAAGLFDGEGHIAIVHRKPRSNCNNKSKYERYTLFLSLSQKQEAVIRWLQLKFGGSVRLVTGSRSYDSGCYTRWDWILSTASAARFLRLVRPHLRVKGEQADVAIAMQNTMTKLTGRSALPAIVVQFRMECFERIRAIRKDAA